MNYLYYAIILLFTILFSTFIGYLIPMMYREQKFRQFWKKCPNCEKDKKKNEVYNVINYWKFGGYCEKHKPKAYKNILFTVFFTLFSISPFVFEYIFTKNVLTVNSFSLYIVTTMLVYATCTDFKGMVIPDMCHIVFFAVGLFNMFYTAITTGDNSVYWLYIIGMFCLSVPFFLFCLLGKSGFGDVKMFGALGLFLGWKNLLLVLFIAVVLGLFYVVYKKLSSKDVKWKAEVPFGPFICMGTYIVALFGDKIINTYLQLF